MSDVRNLIRTPFVVVTKAVIAAVIIALEVVETLVRTVFGAGSHVVSEVNSGIDNIGAELTKLSGDIRAAVKGAKSDA